MSKLAKLFKAITLIIKQPALLNKVLDDADVNKQDVTKNYRLSQGLKTIDITDLLPGFNQTVDPFCYLDGGSTPIDLGLLVALAKNKPECTYFEIGTWRGESVANVARVAKECFTLNLPDEEMKQMGLPANYIGMHRFFSEGLSNVNHLFGNSLTFDYKALHQKCDLVFIDGDHHSESVSSDTQNAFKLLKDTDSVIVWHDYGSTPTDIRWDVLKGILDGTPADKQQYLYHVSNTLCAIYTTKPLASEYIQPFSKPRNSFAVSVKANPI